MPKKKLTPEEKKQLKKEKREKRKQKKEERRRQIGHDELTREIKYTALTVKRHDATWRRTLLKISLPKMREELMFEWQTFERLLDVKDFTISLHMDEVEMAEEQYMRSNREHIEGIDKYMNLYNDVLEDLKMKFENDLKDMRDTANQENQGLNASFSNDEQLFKVIFYGLSQIRKENEKIMRGDLVTKRDEEASRYAEIAFLKRTELENKFTDILQEAQLYIKDFLEKTHTRRLEYYKQYEQDLALKLTHRVHMKKLLKMNERLRKLKEKYEELQKLQRLRLDDLKMEKSYFKRAFSEMKGIMEIQNEKIDSMMVKMTTLFNKLLEELALFEKKGEHILQMMTICMKLQTESEKVFGFRLTVPCLNRKEEKKFRNEFGEVEAPPVMATFWNKIGDSHAMLLAYLDEKECLLIENRKLKERIHRYCLCLRCPALPPISASKGKERIPIIDGKQEVRKYSRFSF